MVDEPTPGAAVDDAESSPVTEPVTEASRRSRGGAHRRSRRGRARPDDVAAAEVAAADDTAQPDGEAPAGQPSAEKAEKAKNGKKAKKQRPFLVEAAVLFAIAIGIALLVHTFLFQAYYIPSGSMENTLHIGDRVLVNKLSYKVGHVQRGQIIVFNGEDSWTPEASVSTSSNPVSRFAHDIGSFLGFAPAGEKDFIKRVIGVPGDHVKCCDDQGRITVNGKALDETYLYSGLDNTPGGVVPTTTAVNKPKPFDIVVPEGRLWVEGDHRSDSADSRDHTGDPGGGTIPEDKVIGRAFVIVWPVSNMGGLGIPNAFDDVPDAASSAAAVGVPYGIGLLAVAPIGFIRLRRHRRRAST